MTVGRNPGANQSQIAKALEIARTNFVPMLDELERRNIIKRLPSSIDRRSYALDLRQESEALTKCLQIVDARHEKKLRRLLGEDDATLIVSLPQKSALK